MNQNMFSGATRAVVQRMGANRDLISNSNMAADWGLLSLVRVTHTRVPFPRDKYLRLDASLQDLMEAEVRPQIPLETRSHTESFRLNSRQILQWSLEVLPGRLPALLSSCGLDTLQVFRHLVDGLKRDGRARLPQPLPRPLQEDGELRWAADFLCLTDRLEDMQDEWEWTEPSPGGLVQVLSVTVLGLSQLQAQ